MTPHVHVVAPDDEEPPESEQVREMARVQPGQDVVSEEQGALADGESSSLAARMRAKAAQLQQRTKAIRVPPDDVWNGSLVAIIRPVTVKPGTRFEALVVEATDHLFVADEGGGWTRDEDSGEFEQASDGGEWRWLDSWADVGELMGVAGEGVSLGRMVVAVCGSRDVLAGFAESVMAFSMGRRGALERVLGE